MKKKLGIFIFVIVLAVITGNILNKYKVLNKIKEDNKISVKKWDNIYNGNNIHYYFEEQNEMNLQQLNEKYNIDVLIQGISKDLEKAVKIMDWSNESLKYKENSMSINGNAQTVLEACQNGTFINNYDFCRVYQEAATSVGLNVRIGELRRDKTSYFDENYNHFICEVWCTDYNKWVAFDVVNNHYFLNGSTPMSAIDLIKSSGKNITYKGGKDDKKYIDYISKFFYSYTIPIDNTIYSKSNINSYVTYINKNSMPRIYFDGQICSPSIYTNNSELFSISPLKKYIDDKSDKIATLIFSRKFTQDPNKITLYGGAFKNSVMIGNYYISINNKPYTKVKDYFQFDLQNGDNIIKLSEDGITAEREVIISSMIE